MAHSGFSARPEDFRFAWANAYDKALHHADEMYRKADIQLKATGEMMELSVKQWEGSRSNLYKTAQATVKMVNDSGANCQSRIQNATQALVEQSQATLERERSLVATDAALRARISEMNKQLRLDQLRFDNAQREFWGQSLWRRLWGAFKYKATE